MSKTILAKFKVGSVTDYGNDNQGVNMSPVSNGSEENTSFSIYTPNGKIELHVTNPEVMDFFKAGEEIYVEFRKEK